MQAPAREEIRIPANGDDLAAWLYRAEGDGETPCVVLMHGFTATRDEQLDRFCERFAAAGCSALAFDFRHTVVRNSRAEKAARSAPNGSLRRYPGLDHFDVYTPPGFDPVIDDQLAFLREHGLAS